MVSVQLTASESLFLNLSNTTRNLKNRPPVADIERNYLKDEHLAHELVLEPGEGELCVLPHRGLALHRHARQLHTAPA